MEEIMKIDAFISYEHSSKSIADNICSVLETFKIRCWYAPRDVIGDYATSICEAIDNAKIFIVVLDKNSSNSPHVLNEVEMAYKRIMDTSSKLVIMPFRVTNEELSRSMEYYIKRMHWIDASSRDLQMSILELKDKILTVIGVKTENHVSTERVENKYFHSDDTKEIKRLAIQREIVKSFDNQVYQDSIKSHAELVVLDIGSNNGDFIMDRLGKSDNLQTLIGLEYDSDIVAEANKKYQSSHVSFYQCDIEDENFVDRLTEICKVNNIEKFNCINISMVILHLKNPLRLLRNLRVFLAKDGEIIIKDIDDGLNIASPDVNGNFEKAFEICFDEELSGYRHSGRQIFTFLKKSGYRNIELIKTGLTTINMDYDQKNALFETYFSFIKDDLGILSAKYPQNLSLVEKYQWCKDNFDDLKEKFFDDNFFFSLGFMLFRAQK